MANLFSVRSILYTRSAAPERDAAEACWHPLRTGIKDAEAEAARADAYREPLVKDAMADDAAALGRGGSAGQSRGSSGVSRSRVSGAKGRGAGAGTARAVNASPCTAGRSAATADEAYARVGDVGGARAGWAAGADDAPSGAGGASALVCSDGGSACAADGALALVQGNGRPTKPASAMLAAAKRACRASSEQSRVR